MTIIEGSKILAEYLGWKYYGFNPESKIKGGWYKISNNSGLLDLPKSTFIHLEDNIWGKYVCRTHSDLRFYNSYDSLFEVIDKLEKESFPSTWENNKHQELKILITEKAVYINLGLRLLHTDRSGLPKKEQLFYALVDAVNFVNKLKNI